MRKSQYFAFQCWVLNRGTTGTIFITSLVWRGLWLEIEPGTSRTRCQHSTTRLSRRRWVFVKAKFVYLREQKLLQLLSKRNGFIETWYIKLRIVEGRITWKVTYNNLGSIWQTDPIKTNALHLTKSKLYGKESNI